MAIHRYPQRGESGLIFCQECQQEKRMGYWMLWDSLKEAIAVCDDCLSLAKHHRFYNAKKFQKLAKRGGPTG